MGSETVRVVWNFLSLAVIRGGVVKTCLLHFPYLLVFFGDIGQVCLRHPRPR